MGIRATFAFVARLVTILVLLASLCSAQKIPTDLKVRQADGSFIEWKIMLVEKPMCMAGDTGAKWAVTNCNTHTMRFWTGLNREQMADMFMHEIMHVVTGCTDMDQDLHDTIYELAPPMRRLLKDNPRWAEFLLHAPVSEPLLQYGVGPVDESCTPAMRSSADTITVQ